MQSINAIDLLDNFVAQIFKLQQSLRDKGYSIIIKDKNKFCHNKRNFIIPSLPWKAFCIPDNQATSPDFRWSRLSQIMLTYIFHLLTWMCINCSKPIFKFMMCGKCLIHRVSTALLIIIAPLSFSYLCTVWVIVSSLCI